MATNDKIPTHKLLYRAAEQLGLEPLWLIPNVLFAVITPSGEQYVNLGCSTLNSQLAVSLAADKYKTRIIMARHDMPSIAFSRARTQTDAEVFLLTHGKIIAKPLRGSGSCDIHVITKSSEMHELVIRNYILEAYVAGDEMRYLILNNKVIGVHQSRYSTSVQDDRYLERISFPQSEWDEYQVELALRAANILDLGFCAVDFLVDAAGQPHLLEVNTAPSMSLFHAPTSGPIIDVATAFLESIITLPSTVDIKAYV